MIKPSVEQSAVHDPKAEASERSTTPVPSLPFEQLQEKRRKEPSPPRIRPGDPLPSSAALPPAEQGPLASKLAALREEAEKLEANGDKVEATNDEVRSENASLREELNRLLVLASPSDTPVMTRPSSSQRAQ